MGCLVEEDLDLRLKVNKVLGNKSFVAFLSLFDFIQSKIMYKFFSLSYLRFLTKNIISKYKIIL